MNASDPLFRIRIDRFEVLQGMNYVPVDRGRVTEVKLHDGVVTVRYKSGGEVALDCRLAATAEVKALLRTLQTQRDRNMKKARLTKERRDIGSILPGILG